MMLKTIRKYIALVIILTFSFSRDLYAHEPLYGLGPDVMFKGGFNPHFTVHFNKHEFEKEVALGYGITRNWTGLIEAANVTENGKTHLGNYMIKSNYRFLKIDRPGLSYKASFISDIVMPFKNSDAGKIFHCALTAGKESLKWYWFTSLGYKKDLSNNNWAKGNQVNYGLTLGARPFKPNYYRPDIVFLLESYGNYRQELLPEIGNETMGSSNNIDIAPTFILTYRNYALRGGVQFGVYSIQNTSKTETNGKVTLEIHI